MHVVSSCCALMLCMDIGPSCCVLMLACLSFLTWWQMYLHTVPVKFYTRCSKREGHALGCLYLEVFSRRRVWPGLDSTEIMMKVCGSYDSPTCMPDLSNLNGVHVEICGSCLKLDQTS